MTAVAPRADSCCEPPALLLCAQLVDEPALDGQLRARIHAAATALGSEPHQPHGSPVDDLGLRTFAERGRWLHTQLLEQVPHRRLLGLLADLPAWDGLAASLYDAVAPGGSEHARWSADGAVGRHGRAAADRWLAGYTGPLGAWDDACEIAGAVHGRLDQGGLTTWSTGRLLTRCATVLATRGDRRADSLYDAAIAAWCGNAWQRYLAGLRAYAGEVKRYADSERVHLRRARRLQLDALVADLAGQRQHPWAVALTCNIDALVAVRDGDDAGALQLIEQASRLLLTGGREGGADVERAELVIQVLVNEVTMLGRTGCWGRAHERCVVAGGQLASVHAGFVGEVHVMRGMCELHLGRPRRARRAATAAISCGGAHLLPRQTAQAHKLHAVASARLGDESAAMRSAAAATALANA